jgi:hypothetical protein
MPRVRRVLSSALDAVVLSFAIDADYGFASYHSKTEVNGNLIHYSRTYEVKDLSVPVAHLDELKKFYRMIAGDERNTVVLKAASRSAELLSCLDSLTLARNGQERTF